MNARAVRRARRVQLVRLYPRPVRHGTVSSGGDVSGNELPNTPDYTFMVGAQLSRALTSAITLYGRGEVTAYGAFHYDDLNIASQEAYSLANFRAGARGGRLFAEAWIKNAFDTHYIPIAFPYPGFARRASSARAAGRRTFGVSGGVAGDRFRRRVTKSRRTKNDRSAPDARTSSRDPTKNRRFSYSRHGSPFPFLVLVLSSRFGVLVLRASSFVLSSSGPRPSRSSRTCARHRGRRVPRCRRIRRRRRTRAQ